MRRLAILLGALTLAAISYAQTAKGVEGQGAWLDPDKTEPEGTHYATFQSRLASSGVSYLIYLPPGYETSAPRRYPAVYWLHGMGGNQRSGARFIAQLGPAIGAGKVPAMIAVLVNGLRDKWWCDSKDGKWPVESVIVKELIPHIDRTYRTIPERGARAVEGFSMGGFGAPHLGFKYPEMFGVIGILAGATDRVETIIAQRPPVFEKIFGDVEYAKSINPVIELEKNISKIRGKTFIRVAVGDKDPGFDHSKLTHELLDRLKVAHEYDIVPGISHNIERVYAGLEEKKFGFYATAFREYAGK